MGGGESGVLTKRQPTLGERMIDSAKQALAFAKGDQTNGCVAHVDRIRPGGERFGAAMNEIHPRISIDPQVCGGKPCIRGTRIWVSLLQDFHATGSSIEEILAEYPQLDREDVLAAIAYRIA